MSLTEWVLYAGIIATALVVGIVGGLVLAWRARQGLRVPEWAKASPSRRLAAVVLSLLAILTVLSSMLTSFELQRVEARRAAEGEAERACVASIVERIAERTRISDSDHQNTTEFVQKLKSALEEDGRSGPAIIRAATKYLDQQDRLENTRERHPISEHQCR